MFIDEAVNFFLGGKHILILRTMAKTFPLSIFLPAAICLSLLVSPESRATTVGLETFNQDPTGASIVGQGGGLGWGGNWNGSNAANGYLYVTRNSSSAGYQPLSYSGYTSSTTPAASGGNYFNFASGFGGDQKNQVARLFDTTTTGTYGSAGLVANAGTIGANNTTLWGSMLYSNDTAGNTTAAFSFQLSGGPGGGNYVSPTLPQGTAGGSGSTNLLIFKINYGSNYQTSDTITLWTNPDLSTFDGTSGGSTSSVMNLSFNQLNLIENYGSGSGAQVSVDDLRFGTSLSDVAPTGVPEPSTWLAGALLVSTAAGGLLRARRRTALPCTL